MPASAMKPMTDLIPKVKGEYDPIAWARTKVAEPGFLPSTKALRRSSEAQDGSNPWTMQPLGLRYIDQAMDVQDRLDRIELEKRLKGER